MPEIIILNNEQPQAITTINLTPEEMLNQDCFIGRDPRSCIILQDSLVSKIHGKISFENDKYYYIDIGSSNGSKLNNELIIVNQKYLLKINDSLQLGNSILLIKSMGNRQDNSPSINLSPQEYMPLANIKSTDINPWTKGDLDVRCLRVINETKDVKTFSFIADPPVLFTYKPGQFVTVKPKIEGKVVKRAYSISSTPSRPHTLEITVKRVDSPKDKPDVPKGLVSNWLHDNIKVGSSIKMGNPMGKFTCFANPTPKLLLISAGSGITPMMSMSRWICDTLSAVDIIFLYSARNPQNIIFKSELELMASSYPNFKLAITLTRPELGTSWFGYTGRLNQPMLSIIAPDFKERNVYVCGSNPFMDSVKSLLQDMNFPMNNYYEESFGGEKKTKKSIHPLPPKTTKTDTQDSEPPVNNNVVSLPSQIAIIPETNNNSNPIISLTKSGKSISCDPEISILESAEDENIDLPHSCRMGACGKCKVKKLEGEVIYDDDDVDCEDGYVLTCIAKPVSNLKLEA